MVTYRKVGLILLLGFIHFFAFSQILNPVKWSSSQKQIDDTTFELHMTATLEDGWHLYSTTQNDGGIGIPTNFTWVESSDYKLLGKIQEKGKLLDVYNELIETQEKYYAKSVTFVQKVEVNKATAIKTEVMFQVCDDEMCLPPDYKEFTFDLTPKESNPQPSKSVTEEPAAISPEDDQKNSSDKEAVEPIVEHKDSVDSSQDMLNTAVAPNPNSNTAIESSQTQENLEIENPGTSANKGLWEIFILGFLGGFAALLMPCIFPMIPLTVSIFTKQSKSRKKGITKALIYGVSIILIYVLLGLIITAIFGPGALNALATNPWVNIAFFALFVIFAISFFGAFELTLPSKWVNQADKGADKGGLIGVFFMALTLVLVSFSCTGPIIGTLLVESASSGALLGPAMGMFGFSLALALPFTLFAIFPSWLNSLPSSGGWLNTVKVSLGFIELAFALKFLSNADLVWQAHWLEREVFLAIWIGIFFVMGLYLLNTFRMSHDSESSHIGWPRLLFATLTFVVVFYMLPGLWGAPLKLLSGLTPPKNYSESPMGFYATGSGTSQELPENAHYGPHQIPSFYDIDDAFAYAKKVNKPVMIDFTGDACANCRKVEDNVWSDPRVREKLSNEVVVASLYVDRMIDLPDEEKVFSEAKGRKLRTIGDKWSAYQIENFKSNSQPLYIIVDEDLERFNTPMGTEMDIDTYLRWMDKGIQGYNQKHK